MLQPNWVKDLALDIEIQQQYDQGQASLPIVSQPLLNCPLLITLGLPHNKKTNGFSPSKLHTSTNVLLKSELPMHNAISWHNS